MKKPLRKVLSLSLTASMVLAGTAIVPAEEGGAYTPGTYTASAQGLGGPVNVTVTTDDSQITALMID